jgi:hypothetical protein
VIVPGSRDTGMREAPEPEHSADWRRHARHSPRSARRHPVRLRGETAQTLRASGLSKVKLYMQTRYILGEAEATSTKDAIAPSRLCFDAL